MTTLDAPHFLGIGAPKSATTWLYQCLKWHPEIWLPPIKELHYFSEDNEGDWFRRLRAQTHMGERLRRLLCARLRSDLGRMHIRNLKWDFRYFLATPNDAWYASLFEAAGSKISGEITPQYSNLPLEKVQSISQRFPHLKLIYLMRDPIDRTWSHIRGRARKQGFSVSDTPPEELLSLLKDPNVPIMVRGDYIGTLDKWGKCFDESRFFVAFMDEIQSDPASLLLRLFSFLGVTADTSFVSPASQQMINRRDSYRMPKMLERELAGYFLEDLRILEERFGPPVTAWKRRAEEALSA